MKLSKLAYRAASTCRNLLAKDYALSPEQAAAVLSDCHRDVDTSCFCVRPESWADASVDASIILPTYNDAAHICRGLDSVLNQKTAYSYEVIVINDGSVDNTAELLRPYEPLPNVTVLQQENRGHSGARNAGLEICRGRYILFHDSDDTLLPGALDALLSCAFAHDADVVAGGYLDELPDGTRFVGLHFEEGPADPAAIPGMTCGKLYRRKHFQNLCFPEGYWYEDSIVAQIILPAAATCRTVPNEIFAYLQNESGVSSRSQGSPKSLDSLYITEKLLREKEAFGLPLDEAAYRHFLHMVLLTYHRTYALEPRVRCAVFQSQRQLKQRFFPASDLGTPLEKALSSGNYRSYLWQCETDWILGRFRGTLH